ncbi:cytochrome P450 [Xylariales sp. AK1849]|nr:cytochrome P450 [Xylariales sp. AK1849]
MIDKYSITGVLSCLGAALFLHCVYSIYRHRIRLKGFPQPPHSFFWGHLHIMAEAATAFPPGTHPQVHLTYISQKYGLKGLFWMDLWPLAENFVVVTDPELMGQLTVTDNLDKHWLLDDVTTPLTGRHSMVGANGSIWKRSHKAASAAFSSGRTMGFVSDIIDETLPFRSELSRLAETGDSFPMRSLAASLVFNIITRWNTGLPVTSSSDGRGNVYRDAVQELAKQTETLLTSWNPATKLLAPFRHKPASESLDAALTQAINRRMAEHRERKTNPSRTNPKESLDCLLLEYAYPSDLSPEQLPMTVEDLDAEDRRMLLTNMKSLFFAGTLTTIDTVCFTYMLLSKHPEVLRKLREEHSRILHADFGQTLEMLRATPHKVNELVYTAAVINETLRLFPIGHSGRIAPAGATVSWKNQAYRIDNTLVAVVNHTSQYDADYFPDPAKFRPERFIDDPKAHSYMRTFSRGPRACPGRDLAMTEIKIILLLTIRDFDFEVTDLKPYPAPLTGFTELETIYGDLAFPEGLLSTKPRRGLPMRIIRRE